MGYINKDGILELLEKNGFWGDSAYIIWESKYTKRVREIYNRKWGITPLFDI